MSSSLIDTIFGTSSTTTTTTTTASNDNKSTTKDHSGLFNTIIPIPDPKVAVLPETRTSKRNQDDRLTKKRKGSILSITDAENVDVFGPKQKEQDDDDDDEDEDEEINHHHHNTTDEDDVNERTIFVGNIPTTYTRKHLRQLFIDCGTISSTRIRSIAVATTAVAAVPTPVSSTNHHNNQNDSRGKKDEKVATDNTVVTNKKGKPIKLPPTLAGQQNVYKKVCINTTTTSTSLAKQCNNGYVVFDSIESVDKALQKHNMIVPVQPSKLASYLEVYNNNTNGDNSNNNNTVILPTDDDVRHIRVDRVVNSNNSNNNKDLNHRDPKRTIFIGNLPYNTDEETLHRHVLQYMKLSNDTTTTTTNYNNNNHDTTTIIENIRIVRHPTTYQCQGIAYILFTSIQYIPIALQTLPNTLYNQKTPIRVQLCKAKTKNDSIVMKQQQQHKQQRSSNVEGKFGMDRKVRTNTNMKSSNVVSSSSSSSSSTSKIPPSPTTRTTKAVGALRRVLQKQQRIKVSSSLSTLDSTNTKSINGISKLVHKKTNNVRKRGPMKKNNSSSGSSSVPKKKGKKSETKKRKIR